MNIEPVKEYREPEYKGFELKTGAKLAAGAAVMALLAGSLSGCEAYGKAMETLGIGPKPTPEIEMLAGMISEAEPPEVDVLDGDVATQVDY